MADRSPLRLTASELERLPYEERLEACWSFIDRVTARLESATRHSVEASDEAGLVTVRVSGAGTVEDVRLERPALHAGARELADAVVAAVRAARSQLTAEVTGALSGIQVDFDGWAESLPRATTQAAEVTEKLRQARERLADATFDSSSDNDEVRAVTDVDGELRGLRLAPLAVRQTDRHTLGELILGCVRRAQAEAEKALADQLGVLGVTTEPAGPDGSDAPGTPDGVAAG